MLCHCSYLRLCVVAVVMLCIVGTFACLRASCAFCVYVSWLVLEYHTLKSYGWIPNRIQRIIGHYESKKLFDLIWESGKNQGKEVITRICIASTRMMVKYGMVILYYGLQQFVLSLLSL